MANGQRKIIVLVGNVGTGKSAHVLVNYSGIPEFVVWNHDEYSIMLNGGKYEYRKEIYPLLKGAQKDFLRRAIAGGFNIVFDGTNINIQSRKSLLTMVSNTCKEQGAPLGLYEIQAIDFGPGDEISLKRRMNDPKGLASEEWFHVHENMQQRYEPPTVNEGFTLISDLH